MVSYSVIQCSVEFDCLMLLLKKKCELHDFKISIALCNL